MSAGYIGNRCLQKTNFCDVEMTDAFKAEKSGPWANHGMRSGFIQPAASVLICITVGSSALSNRTN